MIRLLITACGTPGFIPLVKQLRKQRNDLYIIGTDMDPNAPGKFYVDEFHITPPGSDIINHKRRMYDIIEETEPYIVLPESSQEIANISTMKLDCLVMVNDYNVIKSVENKSLLYKILKDIDIPTPNFTIPYDMDELEEDASRLGYPDKRVCVKPPISKGSRGFRIIDSKRDDLSVFMNERPDSPYMSMGMLRRIMGEESLPDIMLCEFIEDTAYDCMVYANDSNETLLTTVKIRESSKNGLSTSGELVESEKHVEMCRRITKHLKLKYFNGIQFIGDRVIEVNPRISTYIYEEDFCEPWIGLQHAMGMLNEEDVREYQNKVPIGRRFVRVSDQMFYGGG